MKVKEAKERIGNLKNLYENALKIQDCCLKNKEAKEFVRNLEEKTNINTTLQTFATSIASFAADEMKRINTLIDNADIKID